MDPHGVPSDLCTWCWKSSLLKNAEITQCCKKINCDLCTTFKESSVAYQIQYCYLLTV